MIRHLPEGLVPFEECGYDRKPLHPQEGQEFGWAVCATARPRYGRARTDEAFRAAREPGSIAIHGRFRRRREPCGIALSAERKAPRGSRRTFSGPCP